MREIVVGYGAHGTRRHVLAWGMALARRAGARLVVVSVLHPRHGAAPPDEVEDRRREISQLLAADGFEGAAVEIRSGEPAEELLAVCREQGADVIVVGHRDSVAPWGLGEHGTAEHLLRHSPAPFVVVGEKAGIPPTGGPLTVTVGIDGSAANAEAVAVIAGIVSDLDGRSRPVYAADTGASTSRDRPGAILKGQAAAEQVAARLPGHPELAVVNDEPLEGLLRAAEDEGADLIAVGEQGHATIAARLTGQFAHHVMDHARQAVLVVPRSVNPAS